MKKLVAIICTIILLAAMPLSAFAKTMLIGDVNGDGKITAADARLVLRVAAGLEPSFGTVDIVEQAPSTSQDVYYIGDTWRVAGQWELTVISVEETKERNKYSDKNPEAVYIVTYTYKNLGYVDNNKIWDGLYITLNDIIVDSNGKVGYNYPNVIENYPKETPVGAYCEAQVCIGVDHPGDFSITTKKYDGNNNEQKATFYLEVE